MGGWRGGGGAELSGFSHRDKTVRRVHGNDSAITHKANELDTDYPRVSEELQQSRWVQQARRHTCRRPNETPLLPEPGTRAPKANGRTTGSNNNPPERRGEPGKGEERSTGTRRKEKDGSVSRRPVGAAQHERLDWREGKNTNFRFSAHLSSCRERKRRKKKNELSCFSPPPRSVWCSRSGSVFRGF